MLTYFNGILYCGGQKSSITYNDCHFFDPFRDDNPVAFPSLLTARVIPAIVEVQGGKLWAIAGRASETEQTKDNRVKR